jgi:hypothetical protein
MARPLCFAALNLLDGMAISQCIQHHRNQEFLRLDRDIPAGQLIHAVLDNTVEVTFSFDRQHTSHKHPMPELGSLVTRAERSTSPRSPPAGSTPLEGSLPHSPAAGRLHSLLDLGVAISRYVVEHNCKPFMLHRRS